MAYPIRWLMLDDAGHVQAINTASSRLLGLDADLRPKDPLATIDPAVRSLLDRVRAQRGRWPGA